MARMYQKGEHVCYGTHGVCLIEDVRELSVDKLNDTFLVLCPLRDRHSTFFIPKGNETLLKKLRDPITCEEIEELVASVRSDPTEWIEDRKGRMEAFREILSRSDLRELLQLCALLYEKKQSLSDSGKRMTPSDENVLKQAEDLTKNEFAFALRIPADEAGDYIKKRLTDENKGLF